MKKLLPLLLLILIGCSEPVKDSELTELDGLFFLEEKVYNGSMISGSTPNGIPRRKGNIKDGKFDGRWSFILEEDSNSYSELILNYSSGKLLENYHYLYKHNIEEKTSTLEKLLLIDKNSITFHKISHRKEVWDYPDNSSLFNSKSLVIEKINGDFDFSFLSRKKYPPLEWDPTSTNYKLFDYYNLVDSKENNSELSEYIFIENSNPSNIKTPTILPLFEPIFLESSQNKYKLDEKYTLLKQGNDGEWLEYLWEGSVFRFTDEKKYNRDIEKIYLGTRLFYKDGKIDGTVENFYSSGEIFSEIIKLESGFTKRKYFSSGVLMSEQKTTESGNQLETFDINGNLSSVETWDDDYRHRTVVEYYLKGQGPEYRFDSGVVKRLKKRTLGYEGFSYFTREYDKEFYEPELTSVDCDIDYIKQMIITNNRVVYGERLYNVEVSEPNSNGYFDVRVSFWKRTGGGLDMRFFRDNCNNY